MRQSIHISEARRILSYDIYAGTRTIKSMRSGEKRTIHDVQIIALNDFDVFL